MKMTDLFCTIRDQILITAIRQVTIILKQRSK